jgi:hypothetical protein
VEAKIMKLFSEVKKQNREGLEGLWMVDEAILDCKFKIENLQFKISTQIKRPYGRSISAKPKRHA